ncbi:ATP-binding protein [Kitasatospora sp. NPDC050543]|uniref:ATP-binding protein n=1 Tax=Kitasatospora sp. NPDC050543 TaxID=3364054 RepID=UPI00379381EA
MTVKMSSPRGSAPAVAAAGSPTIPEAPARGGAGRGAQAVFTVAADPRSTLRARKLVMQAARGWRVLDEAALGDLELCTAEIVANAVEHTRDVSMVRVSGTKFGVRVEVTDTDPQLPQPSAPDLDRESGRGLLLVDALAAGWGAHPSGTGKTVWFEITPTTAQPAGRDAVRQTECCAMEQAVAA